jgi:nucleotide-binding universal stress UspA family protein
MSTLRSILAATDLSAPSRHAAERAASLAKSAGASLVLVHAQSAGALDDLKRWLGGNEDAHAAIQADVRQRLHAMAEELARHHAINVDEHLLTGNAVKEITQYATQRKTDLLVTGTRGAGFFRGVVTGSTAERIAKCSSRPVLLVRQSPHEPYRRVLVPVDFSPWSVASIELAMQMAPDAIIVLMHAVEVPFEGKLRLSGVNESVVRRYLEEAKREARLRLRELATQMGLHAERSHLVTPDGADPWMLIVQQEQEFDCDLVVIGKHGRNAIEELLLGSTTRMVISECSADVLVSSHHAD